MRTALRAIHTIVLGLWAGTLLAVVLAAVDVFGAAKPICPRCRRALVAAEEPGKVAAVPATCSTCGARHHPDCLAPLADPQKGKPCATGDGGGFGVAPPAPVGSGALASRLILPAEGTLRARPAWRIERTTPALEARHVTRGDVVLLPFPAAGDAAARLFDIARLVGLFLGLIAFPTAFLSPPGGALRFLRAGAILGALALSVVGVTLGATIQELRTALDLGAVDAVAALRALAPVHGKASAAGAVELLLVLLALTLSQTARPTPPPEGPVLSPAA